MSESNDEQEPTLGDMAELFFNTAYRTPIASRLIDKLEVEGGVTAKEAIAAIVVAIARLEELIREGDAG